MRVQNQKTRERFLLPPKIRVVLIDVLNDQDRLFILHFTLFKKNDYPGDDHFEPLKVKQDIPT